jgi:hypothetical protein
LLSFPPLFKKASEQNISPHDNDPCLCELVSTSDREAFPWEGNPKNFFPMNGVMPSKAIAKHSLGKASRLAWKVNE